MSGVDDRTRLLEETARRLEEVAGRGDILEVSRDSSRPDVVTLVFRGKGLAPSMTPGEKFVEGNEWRCELRFPFRYPERPPEVRWRTEIYHPNVPLSGWMSMDDLSMTWSPDAPLDSLCERLWDLIRYAHVDLDQTANFNAREWYASQAPGRFPLDDRTLSVAAKRKHDNVIHYRRVVERGDRSASRSLEPSAPPVASPAPSEPEVTFLGEVSAPKRAVLRPIVQILPVERASPSAPLVEASLVEMPSIETPPVEAPVSPIQEAPVAEAEERVFEIRESEPVEPIPAAEAATSGVRAETSATPSRSRRALPPLPPPSADEGIVFLE